MITDRALLRQYFASVDPEEFEFRVSVYEQEGMTRSDAQGTVDLEMMTEFLKTQ